MMACFGVLSFHDGNGSSVCAEVLPPGKPTTRSAESTTRRFKTATMLSNGPLHQTRNRHSTAYPSSALQPGRRRRTIRPRLIFRSDDALVHDLALRLGHLHWPEPKSHLVE